MRRTPLFGAALSVLLVLAAAVAAPASSALSTATGRKVLWIVMENRSLSAVIGNVTAAPYINGTLVPAGGLATNMHSESHPSLPNYVAMTTGSTQGIADDNGPRYHPLALPNVFGQADPSWKAYQELMPSPCYQKTIPFANNSQYVVRHNPAAYLTAPPISAPAADCTTYDLPLGDSSLGQLAIDLSGGTLPAFSFVTPGICHDMHTPPVGYTCNPANPITAGDQWLAAWMPKILNAPDYISGSLVVFLTWDEGTGGARIKGMDCLSVAYAADVGCHIPTLVFSTATPGGTQDNTLYSHYSMLRTTDDLLALNPADLGPNVTAATSMQTGFHL